MKHPVKHSGQVGLYLEWVSESPQSLLTHRTLSLVVQG